MKKVNFLPHLLFMIVILEIAGCEKETPDRQSNLISAPLASTTNRAPIVNASADVKLEIPATSTVLSGTAYDVNGNIRDYNWRKITGPESYFLEWPYHLSPKLIWLEEGNYEFEFTATDKGGLSGKDTVRVSVFTNLKKQVVYNLTPNNSGFSVTKIGPEIMNNIKWVFIRSAGRCEQADAGPVSGMDYNWGGYYYELLPGDLVSVYGGHNGYTIDVILYY